MTPTPAFKQFEQTMQAQAATRPAGTGFDRPQFQGQAYLPRPIFSLGVTYFALGFAGAGITLLVLVRRLPDRC